MREYKISMREYKNESIVKWLLSDDTGISSKNIIRRFLNLPISSFGWPHDADDFGRCYRMLKICPFIKIAIMKDVDKIWADLVDKWQELSDLYEKDKGVEIYNCIWTIDKKYRKDATLHQDDIQLSYKP